MTALSKVLDALSGEQVHDVIVPGWLEHGGGHPRFVPWSKVLYVELDQGFLRLEADQGALILAMADRITVPPQMDDDDEFAVASLGSMFVFDGGPAPLTQVRYWTHDLSEAGRAVVRHAEFEVRGGIRLFVDPWWMPGMRLATGGFYDRNEADLAHEREVFGVLETYRPGQTPVEALRLATDPGLLAEQLSHVQPVDEGPQFYLRAWAEVNAWYSPDRAQHAAALAVFRDTDGIDFHLTARDRAGRTGIGLSVTSDNGGTRDLLILDPRTVELLAFEMTAMRDPGRLGITEPTVLDYHLFLAHTHTATTGQP